MSEPRDILEALFVGEDVDRAQLGAAVRTAREDADVRALFDELALVDREVGGDFEARAGEAWFLDSLDTMLAEEARETEEPDNVVSLDTWRSRIPIVLAAAAVVAVGLGAVLYQDSLFQPEPQFQPRSAVTPPEHDYEMPSVEVFCVNRTEDGVEFVGSEQAELATVTCELGQEIKLAVRNPDARLRHAAFFGIGDDDSLYWYGPSPAAPEAVDVPSGAELAPIGETIRLDVNHKPGTVRVIGVFAEQPLEFTDVEALAQEHAHALRDGESDTELGVVVRQTFEVTQ